MVKESKRRIVAEFAARNKAKGVIAGFRRDLTSTARTMRNLVGTTVALAGIGGLGYLIKQQMAAIDANAKLSDRLGMTTQSLIALQHGAQINGVQQATLNKSLEIFSRRLGEVNMGVGQAKYALKELGLSAADLAAKSPDEAIKIVADQINRLPNAAQKAAAANYLFGRSGQSLINLFSQGSAGIDAYREEVERLGIAYDRVDAAKVEAANDALTRMKAVLTGVMQTIVIEVSPHIEAVADNFVDAAATGEGFGNAVAGAAEQAAIGVVYLATEIENLARAMARLKEGPSTVKTGYLMVKRQALEAKRQALESKAGNWNNLTVDSDIRVGRRSMQLVSVTDAIEAIDRELDQLTDRFHNIEPEDPKDAVAAISAYFDKLSVRSNEIERGVKQKRATRQAGTGNLAVENADTRYGQSAIDPTTKYFSEIDREMDLMRSPSLDSIETRRQRAVKMAQMEAVIQREKIANGKELLAQYDASLQKLFRLQEMEVMARGIGDAFGDAMEQVIMGAKSAEEALQDMAAAIAQIVLRQTVIQPIANAVSSGIMSAVMMHDGGTVGSDGTPIIASSSLFDRAPSFKGGRRLASDEFAAILHKDEEVIPSGESGRNQTNIGIFADKNLFNDWLNSNEGTTALIRWNRRNQASLG